MITIPGKTKFTLDRQTMLPNGQYKKGGGLCIYIDNKYGKFCTLDSTCTISNDILEILTIKVRKPGFKYLNISVIYKPPKISSKLLFIL